MAYTYALRHLPVSFVSLYAYINPIIAVTLGVLVLNEPFTRAHGDCRRARVRGSGNRAMDAHRADARRRQAEPGATGQGGGAGPPPGCLTSCACLAMPAAP